ncbi:hypothetical protein [Labrenzia sp. THAF82]|uniref:hypothetical protein n=1 Tax=Labrenzia sp. THAF82 TaxID=2587861 RepID=UPI001AD8F44F|nr:hypothetical protein [Labrenzia sp. THAF82]
MEARQLDAVHHASTTKRDDQFLNLVKPNVITSQPRDIIGPIIKGSARHRDVVLFGKNANLLFSAQQTDFSNGVRDKGKIRRGISHRDGPVRVRARADTCLVLHKRKEPAQPVHAVRKDGET